MTLAQYEADLRANIVLLGKITSAAKGKALVPAFTALADQVPSLIAPILERRAGAERRVAKDVPGSPSRRLGQRRFISQQIVVTV